MTLAELQVSLEHIHNALLVFNEDELENVSDVQQQWTYLRATSRAIIHAVDQILHESTTAHSDGTDEDEHAGEHDDDLSERDNAVSKTEQTAVRRASQIMERINDELIMPSEFVWLLTGERTASAMKMEDEAFVRLYRGYAATSRDIWVCLVKITSTALARAQRTTV